MTASPDKPLRFIDAFAGCGGLSLGLLQSGCKGLFAIEQDRFAFETLRTNLLSGSQFRFDWPDWLPQEPLPIASVLSSHEQDLLGLRGNIDVLVGGPPCQGFSSAGRRLKDDPRNSLFRDYLKLVDLIRPKVVVIENVRGFMLDFDRDKQRHNYAEELRNHLCGRFDVFERLLDLSEFGVPQARKRYFLFAFQHGIINQDPFEVLKRQLPSYLRHLGLHAPVSAWSALSDLEIARGGTQPSSETLGFNEIFHLGPQTAYQKLMADGTEVTADLRLARHSPELVERFRLIIERSHADGRLCTAISRQMRAEFGLKKLALRVLDPDQPAPTVTSMPDDLLHYKEPRTLTVRENARLQSFPDWFKFAGKYTTGGHLRRKEVPRFTQVANAVPPLVARAIGKLLTQTLRDQVVSTGSSRSGQRRKKIAELTS